MSDLKDIPQVGYIPGETTHGDVRNAINTALANAKYNDTLLQTLIDSLRRRADDIQITANDAQERAIKYVGIGELDSLTAWPTEREGALDYMVTTPVGSREEICGRLFVFGDGMRHKVTQVLLSCSKFDAGFPSTSHDARGLTIYFRFYGLPGGPDVPAGAWTEWRKIFDTEDQGPVLDIGTFDGINAACDFAARAEIAGNGNAVLLIFHVRTSDPNKTMQGQIFQQRMHDDVAMQIRMYDRRLHRRNVTGATGIEGDATNAFSWEEFGAQKLQYDSATKKLTMKSYENGVIAEVTLPEATSQNAGLMTGAHLTRLNNTLEASVGAFDADISATTKNNPVTAKMVGTTVQGGDIVFAWYKLEGLSLTSAGFLYRVGLQYYNVSPDAAKPIPNKKGLLTNREKTAVYICVNDELQKVIG